MLHPDTFAYQKPTDHQLAVMEFLRQQFLTLAQHMDANLEHGPDKTYAMRHLRETAMWVNVAITKTADGGPRP